MRVNLGCGPVTPDEWVNVDVVGLDDRVVVCDVTREDLPFPIASVEGMVCNHMLQMVPWPSLVPALTRCRRVMLRGAVLRILVPDLLGAVAARSRGEIEWFPIDDAHESTIDGKLCLYLSQAGSTRSVFTGPWLVDLCERAGFRSVEWIPKDRGTTGPAWLRDLDSRPDESIVVEATR